MITPGPSEALSSVPGAADSGTVMNAYRSLSPLLRFVYLAAVSPGSWAMTIVYSPGFRLCTSGAGSPPVLESITFAVVKSSSGSGATSTCFAVSVSLKSDAANAKNLSAAIAIIASLLTLLGW
jgi:hypothetical protein